MDYPFGLPGPAQANLPQPEASYTEPYHSLVQQAYGTYVSDTVSGFPFGAQLPTGSFASTQDHALQPSGLSSLLPSYVQYDTTLATGSESAIAAPAEPTSPMGPPARPRKRKAATLRADDWEPYKQRILDLHITQNLPLPKVKQTIEAEYGFKAELRQYRSRISTWGKDKNVKSHEMQAIVRKRQKRKLVETSKGPLVFEVRGSQVELQKIERWMKKNDVVDSALYDPNAAGSTPSVVECRTISERGSPAMISVYSPAASVLSPGGVFYTAQSPQMSSPALSVSSIVRPQVSTFAGQSPALTYRSLPNFQPSFGHNPSTYGTKTNIGSQPRYREDEERRLWDQLRAAGTSSVDGPSERSRVLYQLGEVLIEQGRYKTAETVARKLVESHERQDSNGDDDVGTLDALYLLGVVLDYQGLYVPAEKLCRVVLRGRKNVLGPKDPDTLESMYYLANMLTTLDQLKEAEKLHEEALVVRREVLGLEHPDTLTSMSGLGIVWRDQRRYEESEALHRETLALRRKVLGPQDNDTLVSMNQLGSVLGAQGKYEEAEAMLEDVFAMSKRLLGPEHPDTLNRMYSMASLWDDQGKYKEAEAMYREELAISQRVLGPEHPNTLATVRALQYLMADQAKQGR